VGYNVHMANSQMQQKALQTAQDRAGTDIANILMSGKAGPGPKQPEPSQASIRPSTTPGKKQYVAPPQGQVQKGIGFKGRRAL